MSSYKVIYFNSRGRAEAIRLALTVAGQEFEDVRVTPEEWQKLKPDMPQGQLPVLEVDGVRYSQSGAILRYVGRAFGLYGKGNMQETQVDVVLETINDFLNAAAKWFYEKDEEKKKNIAEDIKKNAGPKFGKSIEDILKKNGTDWLVGDGLTIADLAVFTVFDGLHKLMMEFTSDILENCSTLKCFCDKVSKVEGVSKWIKNRPETEN